MKKIIGKQAVYPEYVDEALSQLCQDDREEIIKCVIYSLMEPVEKGIQIHKGLQSVSNRIAVLPNIKEALVAVQIGLSLFPWHVSENREKNKVIFKTIYKEDK